MSDSTTRDIEKEAQKTQKQVRGLTRPYFAKDWLAGNKSVEPYTKAILLNRSHGVGSGSM